MCAGDGGIAELIESPEFLKIGGELNWLSGVADRGYGQEETEAWQRQAVILPGR